MAAGDKAFWSDLANAINPPTVRLIQQAAQSMGNSAAVAITFGAGSEDIDTHGFHDTVTNNTRITPTVAGRYELIGTVLVASGTLSQLAAVFRKNGGNIAPLMVVRPDPAAASSGIQVTATATANGSTDFFELIGIQTSGGALNTNLAGAQVCTFECRYTGPT